MPDSAATDSRFAYAADHALARAGDGYFTWLDHIWHAAACTHPIRLRGQVQHIDPATGELLRTITTDTMPDQVMYKPCGNRRATTCPGCAETYRRDAYHLIRAGLIGGKGVTPAVAAHPAVFATFTAPSFGPVHTRQSASTPAPTGPAARAGPSPATPAASPAAANTADLTPASPATPATTPALASRSARTATTTTPTPYGTTRPGNCGGAPSKPSNATSASSPADGACPPSGSPAGTANTA